MVEAARQRDGRMVQCERCGAELPSDFAQLADQPCPICGFTAIKVTLTLRDTLTIRESLCGKVKDSAYNSKRNPRHRFKVGASWSTKHEKWMHREMDVNKDQGTYREVVVDPGTGKVVHHCEEPLSQHQGHGSAKPRKAGED